MRTIACVSWGLSWGMLALAMAAPVVADEAEAGLARLAQTRARALELIRDEAGYAKAGPLAKSHQAQRAQGQAEVDRAVGEVEAAAKALEPALRRAESKLKAAGRRELLAAEPSLLPPLQRELRARLELAQVLEANEALARRLGGKGPGRLDPWQVEETRLTNHYRALLGLRALRIDPRLVEAAQGHADEMRRLDYFAHESPTPGRESPRQRADLARFDGRGVGENIVAGTGAALEAHRAWLASPGHHRNIVVADWDAIGVAHSGDRGVQVFGDSRPVEVEVAAAGR